MDDNSKNDQVIKKYNKKEDWPSLDCEMCKVKGEWDENKVYE